MTQRVTLVSTEITRQGLFFCFLSFWKLKPWNIDFFAIPQRYVYKNWVPKSWFLHFFVNSHVHFWIPLSFYANTIAQSALPFRFLTPTWADEAPDGDAQGSQTLGVWMVAKCLAWFRQGAPVLIRILSKGDAKASRSKQKQAKASESKQKQAKASKRKQKQAKASKSKQK